MTLEELDALIDGLAPALKELLTRAVAAERTAREADQVTIHARLASLEEKAAVSLKFCGTWTQGRTYEAGDCVQHGGSLYICRAATPGRPTEDHDGWRLAVKKGSA